MKALRRLLLSLLLVLVLVAVASEAGGQEDGTGFMDPLSESEETGIHERGAQILGIFLLLGGVAYGAVHWQKRRGKHLGSTIRVLAVKPLGQREKVAILEVLGERMVLGITAHRISLLSQGPVPFSSMMAEEEESA
jgi:flagellar biogenesis protein FliO